MRADPKYRSEYSTILNKYNAMHLPTDADLAVESLLNSLIEVMQESNLDPREFIMFVFNSLWVKIAFLILENSTLLIKSEKEKK